MCGRRVARAETMRCESESDLPHTGFVAVEGCLGTAFHHRPFPNTLCVAFRARCSYVRPFIRPNARDVAVNRRPPASKWTGQTNRSILSC